MEGIISNEMIACEVEKAMARIGNYVRRTALDYSAYLSKRTGANVFLKLESEQLTGAFKARGAFNKILKFCENQSSDAEDKKFYTASSGNHGLGMTFALKAAGKKGIIYVTNNVAKSKEDILLMHDAELRKYGYDCIEAEKKAMSAAEEEGGIYVSPYNDPDIVAGQGTIAHEIIEDCKDVDAIFVTVGGGGLISGVSSYIKHVNPKIQIIGCSPFNSNAMQQSVKVGKQIDIVIEDTVSDSSAGNVDIPSITFPLCQRNVDRWVDVTEEEIGDAIYLMLDVHHKVVEGSAGVALASFLKIKDEFRGQNIAIVICGSSIGVGTLKKIIDART